MKKVLLILAILLITAGTSQALTVLDFENISQNHWFYGDAQNLGEYYQGVRFGPMATVLENNVYGFRNNPIPTHSGDAVLFSSNSIGIQIDFESYINHAEFHFASFRNLGVLAYDENWNLVDRICAQRNLDMSGFVDLNSDSYNIAHIRMGSFNYAPFIIDDFGYEPLSGGNPVPEPSTVLLLASGLLGMSGLVRFRKRK